MQQRHIVVVGGGFAGLWAAAGAATAAHTAGDAPSAAITLVTPSTSLSVRPRLYEADLEATTVDLRPLIEPIGVQLQITTATHIDPVRRTIRTGDGSTLSFDAAVLTIGSSTPFPPLRGLAEHAHRIDIHHHALAFREALETARARSHAVRVSIVGGGLTGIELAAELASAPDIEVTLIDGGVVGQSFGEDAMGHLRAALADLGVKVVDGDRVVAATASPATLQRGGRLDHDLLVWCGGLRANSVAGLEAFEHDDLGRLVVDSHLRVAGSAPVWAAGDSARFLVDSDHVAPMSCQFAIPSGRVAGLNAAATILGLEPEPLALDRYVTCVDLGRAGAVFTDGWDRRLVHAGAAGKRVKRFINLTAIHPPSTPEALLAAAAEPGELPAFT